MPISRVAIERLLRELLDQLCDSLAAEKVSPAVGRKVGEQLVAGYFTDEQGLARTMEVLGRGLPANPELQGVDGLAGKVVSLLGAVAAGYAAALRAHTFDQQEEVKQALLKARQDAERGLRVSEAKFRQLFTSSAVGIAISDLEGRLAETNQALREIVGELAAGHSLYNLFHPDDVAPLRVAYQELVEERRTGSRLPQRIRLIDKDGEPAWTYLAVTLLRNVDGEPTEQVTIMEDVTELHLLGQELRHQSLHDALTGLPNQQFFMSTLDGVLHSAGQGSRITVCKIDLDGLAVINDGFGREIGDQVLQSAAGRLQAVVAGEKAIVARFGSDEFAILIENSAATPDVATIAASINSALAEPMYTDGAGLAVSGCVGVVQHQGRGGEVAMLLRAAEAALHRVKSGGQRQWGLFDPHRDAGHRSRCRLAAAMPGAWENGEISLDYQPLVSLDDGTVVGIQALLRWNHPHTGPLSHHECTELAARIGLMAPLGQWMLHGACAQRTSWRQLLGEATPLHVALTPQQSYAPDLVAGVVSTLEQTGLAAESLQLGVPVSALDAEPDETEDNLRVLAEMGVSIVLLGFRGVADFAYLEQLPVRTVELAPGVVQRVVQRLDGGSAVARTVPVVFQLVHCYGGTVIVRGIDTHSEADWWRSAGADIGQGEFLAPPASPDEIAALLGSR
ncbi:MAG TPA: EAL domain-containing protein [Pseudonocardiaceae bacterium]|nr:EAL domain-containing protein [Pseudonocardiaceae bacterium]